MVEQLSFAERDIHLATLRLNHNQQIIKSVLSSLLSQSNSFCGFGLKWTKVYKILHAPDFFTILVLLFLILHFKMHFNVVPFH